ncbi:Aste57867_306 [Aphanomyces stellatus]|uniref:Aste57867_306 protein n=1 Tax=Aphanomyces stellatus TaxID=120398 RepID=A0A485K6F1_9STRA|nr:hypothetical protein As57867_000306 [Aphanomyces stellatus]VFT77532.1 Aste57867_306 [Aphanomyces stellatus]
MRPSMSLAAFAAMTASVVMGLPLAPQHSFGTLVECTDRCLWMGKDSVLVDGERLLLEMLATHHRGGDGFTSAKRNLEGHMQYVQDVYVQAKDMQHVMSTTLGVNSRSLLEDPSKLGNPLDAVLLNMQGSAIDGRFRRRQLQATSSNALLPSLNWCTTENPMSKSVCAEVKSQKLCGSCWAFAATDLMETAVAIANPTKPPLALSSQQLLSCSISAQVVTYFYCFAKSPGIPTWLELQMKWDSKNNGCNGGMTHIALMDAASKIVNLASRIDWPYTNENTASTSGGPVAPPSGGGGLFSKSTIAPIGGNATLNSCSVKRPAEKTAASIQGWQQALNDKSCTDTKDTVTLLKRELQKGPLAVALNANSAGFKSYKGGVHVCGSITDPSLIDHALLLVGYGKSPEGGDYWILKNSYDVDWGLNGYMWLKMDNELNCGLNVFPVRVYGASTGAAANITVDGGGTLTFVGMSMMNWAVIGGVIGVASVVLTIIGVIIARKRSLETHL